MSLRHGPAEDSLKSRQAFLSAIGIDHRRLIGCQQVHGDRVAIVTGKDAGKGAMSWERAIADTDALVTIEEDLPLAVFTADCLSLFFFDPVSGPIGIAHAGWRGTRLAIASRVVEAMSARFGSRPKDLLVGFGPSIRQCCYEVGAQFADIFPKEVIRRQDRIFLDLAAANKRQLYESGIEEDNISDTALCTACRNERFFSYRLEGQACGRMISVIMLKRGFRHDTAEG
jgi:YfiH family protein